MVIIIIAHHYILEHQTPSAGCKMGHFSTFPMTDVGMFFRNHPKVMIALSGGVDSSFVLHLASVFDTDFIAVHVRTPLSHSTDVDVMMDVCNMLDTVPEIIESDVLSIPEVKANGPDRCYHCKKAIFSAMRGIHPDRVILDGTNASDDVMDRPGFRALQEAGVLSPLRICGITKPMVREMARSAGLPNWNRPSESCLATRIPTGIPLTIEDMGRVCTAEGILHDLGFRGFRIRSHGKDAELWFDREQVRMAESKLDLLASELSPIYDRVTMGGIRENL